MTSTISRYAKETRVKKHTRAHCCLPHALCNRQGSSREALFVMLACFVCLVSGAPLGPEMALGSCGTGLASLLASLLKVNRRTEALWVMCGIVGALGGLFPSPLLGMLFMVEFAMVARPLDYMIDSLVATEVYVPGPRQLDHDVMEQMTLGGAASMASFVVIRLLVPSSYAGIWKMTLEVEGSFRLWHLAAAIPLGMMGSVLGNCSLILNGIFRGIRKLGTRFLTTTCKCPTLVANVFFPTLAGTLHGLLSIWNPHLLGSGIRFILEISRATSSGWLVATAFCKVVSMTLCLGFGLVGGPIFPMALSGLCLGVAVSNTLSVIPSCLAIPCLVCGTLASCFPAPFFLVILSAMLMDLTPEQMGPPLIATFFGFTFTGGVGFLKKFGEARLGVTSSPQAQQPQQQHAQQHQHQQQQPSDDEILQNVRTAVFGSYSEF